MLPTVTVPDLSSHPVYQTQESLRDLARARRIIIVDDSPLVRRILEVCLRREYFDVKTFSSATQFYQFLVANKELSIDLFLIDINLPETDGYTVSRTLKKRDRYKPIPIIILTPFADIMSKVRVRLAGACDCIIKPFKTKEVIALIMDVLKVDHNKYTSVQEDLNDHRYDGRDHDAQRA